jgi:3-hydroxyisobutyrate dehydrogenase-like beta-hydroxyacid dehydrogenase
MRADDHDRRPRREDAMPDPEVTPRTVAFCGLGMLGGPVCDALVASPHQVAAYDPRTEALDAPVVAGARRATSPADAADGADVLIVFVRDDAQAVDVVTGPEGMLRTARPGSVVVLHATVAPATVRQLDAACRTAEVGFVDAGISTGGGRLIGDLFLMCGGDAEVIDAVRPVLAVYASEIVRFGEVGAGMTAKLIRNAVRYGMYGVLYEGLALAEAAGIDLAAMVHLHRATFATNGEDDFVLDRPTMVPIAPDDPEADAATVAFRTTVTTLGWKDLDGAEALAVELGRELPLARAARALLGPAFGIALQEEVHP